MQLPSDQVQDFLNRYRLGERRFAHLEIDNGNMQGVDLQSAVFENCFLSVDFRHANLINSKFINCNLKTCDFREANLTNACIEGSSVEAARFKDALTDGFLFCNNHWYSETGNQEEFEKYIQNE